MKVYKIILVMVLIVVTLSWDVSESESGWFRETVIETAIYLDEYELDREIPELDYTLRDIRGIDWSDSKEEVKEKEYGNRDSSLAEEDESSLYYFDVEFAGLQLDMEYVFKDEENLEKIIIKYPYKRGGEDMVELYLYYYLLLEIRTSEFLRSSGRRNVIWEFPEDIDDEGAEFYKDNLLASYVQGLARMYTQWNLTDSKIEVYIDRYKSPSRPQKGLVIRKR